jgi:hypothetical protein
MPYEIYFLTRVIIVLFMNKPSLNFRRSSTSNLSALGVFFHMAPCLQLIRGVDGDAWRASYMWLTRREILEQLGRLGIRTICDLKKACREFEAYWNYHRQRV